MAYLAATGQIKYDADSNRWITQAGRTYTADLSSLSDEQIPQLDAAGRKAVSGEAKLDEQRAMVAAAEAQQKAAAEAAAAQTASAKANAAQQTTADVAGGASETSVIQRVEKGIAENKKDTVGYWTKQYENADTWYGATAVQVMRAAARGGFAFVESLVGTVELAGNALDKAGQALADPVGTLEAIGKAEIAAAVPAAIGSEAAVPVVVGRDVPGRCDRRRRG